MKVASLLITLSFLLSLGMGVLAQETELPDPGLTPDSPFYFLKSWKESIQTFFTFGAENKAKQYLHLSEVRLAEYEKMVEKGKTEIAQKTFEKYEKQLNHALEKAGEAKEKGKNIAAFEKEASEKILKHQEVLERVLEKAPEQAKPAIEKAIEELKQKDIFGQNYELVKTKCLEQGGTPEFCTSLVNDLRNPKSPRSFCAEMGGPSEMCEKIPLSFESFEAIEAYCLESGGPSDQCATLVEKCEEFGITTPDACFRFLSTAAITTYKTTAPTIVPVPALPEGQMQQERIQIAPEGETAPVGTSIKQRYMPGVSKVIMYSLPTCPHCAEAKEWLGQHNIEYEEIDISKSEAAQEELRTRTGSAGVPTVVMDNNVLVGFSAGSFSEFFGIE
ncbi:MAG: DUF5667 domain-containing protein [Parcubacteria group bacterium]